MDPRIDRIPRKTVGCLRNARTIDFIVPVIEENAGNSISKAGGNNGERYGRFEVDRLACVGGHDRHGRLQGN